MEKKFNLYEAITERITKALSEGNIPWEKPWVGNDSYRNQFNNKPYSLLNQLLLAAQKGNPGGYASFKQWTDAGFKIKYGAKSKMVTFWKMLQRDTDEDGNPLDEPKTIPVLRYYSVFSAEDVTDKDGNPVVVEAVNPDIPSNSLDDLLTGYYAAEGIKYTEAGTKAFYRPSKDEIVLPPRSTFKTEAGYYSTKAHETIHSTGAESRLQRIEDSKFGDEKYAKEELVAEIGANFLLAMYGISTEKSNRNTDAYCKSWSKVLKDNPRWIVSAASKAEKGVQYIKEHQAEVEAVDEPDDVGDVMLPFDDEPTAKPTDEVTYYVAKSNGEYEKRVGKMDGDSGCVIEKRDGEYVATDYMTGACVAKCKLKKDLVAKLNSMADKLSKLRTTDKYKAMCDKLTASTAKEAA